MMAGAWTGRRFVDTIQEGKIKPPIHNGKEEDLKWDIDCFEDSLTISRDQKIHPWPKLELTLDKYRAL